MNKSEEIIESLVAAVGPYIIDERERYFYRETLRSLVRLAQAEQIISMQEDFHRVEIAMSPQFRRSA